MQQLLARCEDLVEENETLKQQADVEACRTSELETFLSSLLEDVRRESTALVKLLDADQSALWRRKSEPFPMSGPSGHFVDNLTDSIFVTSPTTTGCSTALSTSRSLASRQFSGGLAGFAQPPVRHPGHARAASHGSLPPADALSAALCRTSSAKTRGPNPRASGLAP